jgi:hypothetical protein
MPSLARLLRRSSSSAVLMLSSIACSTQATLPDVSNAVQVSRVCEAGAEGSYFPKGTLRSITSGRSEAEWTRPPAKILAAMREPSLACGSEPNSYRILWTHSLPGYPPTMVRVSWTNNRWTLTAVQLLGSMDRTEARREERQLADHEALDVLEAIDAFGLWQRRDVDWNRGVDDRELWVVEGRLGDSYHPVFLANADRRATRKLALVFLKGTAIDPQKLGLGGWDDRPPGIGER